MTGLKNIIKFFPAIAMVIIYAGNSPAGAQETASIDYRLKWVFNASVAGDIYAEVNGLFASAGLNVTVKPGGPERDAIKEIELGRAQFGVASADQVIRAVDKGARIVVVAQLFQINPLQWIYRPRKTCIRTPKDLEGKMIGITYGGIDENIMKALLAKHHIDEDDVSFYSVRYDFTPFYQGKVDLWPIYRNAQGPIIGSKLMAADETVDFFDPDAHGIHSVANSIITAPSLLKSHPKLVETFLTALLEGWQLAMDPENITKTVRTIHMFDKDTSPEIIERQLMLTRRFVKPSPDTRIGAIDVPAWKDTETMMVQQELIPSPVGIEGYLKDLSAPF
ncbi:MAG: ABC transporter substrate-binding protein [Desulfobacterales bacterium]